MEGDREVGLVVDCGVRSRPQAGIIRAEVGHIAPYWYYVVRSRGGETSGRRSGIMYRSKVTGGIKFTNYYVANKYASTPYPAI